MKAEIITIGNELIRGGTVDLNYRTVVKYLTPLALEIIQHTSVGDDPDNIARVLEEAFSRADIIITTGGLGSTSDDLTREGLAKFLKVTLKEDKAFLKTLKKFGLFEDGYQRVALKPSGSEWLPNHLGYAPGIYLERVDKQLYCLPGVPLEMEAILREEVLPRLVSRQQCREKYLEIIRTAEIREIQLQKLVQQYPQPIGVEIAYYPDEKGVDLVLTATQTYRSSLVEYSGKLKKALGWFTYAQSWLELEDVIGQKLETKKRSVSTAESCTGGLLAAALVNVPGASHFFSLGIVAYSNEQKVSSLGVEPSILKEYGAVSKEAACTMAQRIRILSKTHYGIGITGIAGPAGGTPEKPVGTVYIALDKHDQTYCRKYNFSGNRKQVRDKTRNAGLFLLWLELNEALIDFEFINGSQKV